MTREYRHLSKTWYGEASLNAMKDEKIEDQILIGMYDEDGGTDGEFAISWIDFHNDRVPSPRIEIFDDAWKVAFHMFGDVLMELAKYDRGNIPPEKVCGILKSCGIVDATEYEGKG